MLLQSIPFPTFSPSSDLDEQNSLEIDRKNRRSLSWEKSMGFFDDYKDENSSASKKIRSFVSTYNLDLATQIKILGQFCNTSVTEKMRESYRGKPDSLKTGT